MALLDFCVDMRAQKVIVRCSECGGVVVTVPYKGYREYGCQRRTIKNQHFKCEKCGKSFENSRRKALPHWERNGGDYIASCATGDFIVWRYGYVWKCRFRLYGHKEPLWVKTAVAVECAKGICEKSIYWTLKE